MSVLGALKWPMVVTCPAVILRMAQSDSAGGGDLVLAVEDVQVAAVLGDLRRCR